MRQWYFIHTYSGHENKVVESLYARIRDMQLDELITAEGDGGADGSIDNRTTYTRDDRGDALTEEYDGDGDGALESRTTYTYECWPE